MFLDRKLIFERKKMKIFFFHGKIFFGYMVSALFQLSDPKQLITEPTALTPSEADELIRDYDKVLNL